MYVRTYKFLMQACCMASRVMRWLTMQWAHFGRLWMFAWLLVVCGAILPAARSQNAEYTRMRREPCLHPKWHKLEDSSSRDVGKGSRRIKYVQYDRVKIGVPLPSQNFGGHTAAIGLIAGRMATSPAILSKIHQVGVLL